MQRTITCSATLMTLLVVSLASPLAFAQTVAIDYTDRGWYDNTGFHDPINDNYFVGENFFVYHNYFVFDLSSVVTPIKSAKLALFVPSAEILGYVSADPSENYELHDVVTPFASLMEGTGGVAAYNDLGSGVVYGSRTMTAADQGSVVEVTLNATAVAAMNATHGLFGIGGSLTTLDAMASNEWTFGNSGLVTDVTQLRLTLVPEPSTLVLLGLGAISLLGYRRRAFKCDDL